MKILRMQRAELELTLQHYARAGWHSFPDAERQTLACHNVSTLQDPRGKRGTQQKKEKNQNRKKQKGTTPAVSFHKNLQSSILIISGWLERVALCTSQPPPSHRKVGIVPIFVAQQQKTSRKAIPDVAVFNWESEFSDLT